MSSIKHSFDMKLKKFRFQIGFWKLGSQTFSLEDLFIDFFNFYDEWEDTTIFFKKLSLKFFSIMGYNVDWDSILKKFIHYEINSITGVFLLIEFY